MLAPILQSRQSTVYALSFNSTHGKMCSVFFLQSHCDYNLNRNSCWIYVFLFCQQEKNDVLKMKTKQFHCFRAGNPNKVMTNHSIISIWFSWIISCVLSNVAAPNLHNILVRRKKYERIMWFREVFEIGARNTLGYLTAYATGSFATFKRNWSLIVLWKQRKCRCNFNYYTQRNKSLVHIACLNKK